MTLEIAYDLVCPWCYLAKARVDQALARNSAEKQLPRWLPYQLTPDLAPEGVDHATFFAHRVGAEKAKSIYSMMEHKAEEQGLKLDYSRIKTLPNTRKAHSLVKIAGNSQMAAVLIGQLLSAHFAEGRDIGQDETLLEIGAAAGFKTEHMLRAFSSDESFIELQQLRTILVNRGIKGVPAFMVGGQVVASGLPELRELTMLFSAVVSQPAPDPRT